MIKGTMRLTAAVAMLATACSEGDTESSGGGGGTGGEGGGGGSEASYTALMTADWELDPFSENTSDKHVLTLERDIYVNAIRPIAPPGTHHTTLSTSKLGNSEGIYAAGVGTNPLEFPAGVGLKLAAGTSLVLELHLFNPSGEPISGTSGIEIVEVAAEDVVEEAGVFSPGPMELTIPPNQETVANGTCTVLAPFTVFALLPHMHQLGSHLRTTIESDGVDNTIYDGAFTFEEQYVHPIEGVSVKPGDKIKTQCTFNNTTSSLVTWGVSSTDEMCFSVMYRYPTHKDGGFCTQ